MRKLEYLRNHLGRFTLQKMAESTDCPVCLEEFTDDGDKCPKLLPCSHTLCIKCLGQLPWPNPRNLWLIECPECRVAHKVPPTRSTGFPTNRYVLHILNLEKKITELENKEVEYLLCQLHQKPCVMFCLKKECCKTLCSKCPVQEHLEHNVVSLAESLQESPELNGIKQLLMDTKKLLETYADQVREANQIILVNKAKAQKAIEEATTALHEMIDRKSKELKQKVEENCDDQSGNLQTLLNDVNEHIKLGTKIENDFSHRSEKNISKGVPQLIQFQSRCYGFKEIAQQKTPRRKEYRSVCFLKNDNQVDYSRLL